MTKKFQNISQFFAVQWYLVSLLICGFSKLFLTNDTEKQDKNKINNYTQFKPNKYPVGKSNVFTNVADIFQVW